MKVLHKICTRKCPTKRLFSIMLLEMWVSTRSFLYMNNQSHHEALWGSKEGVWGSVLVWWIRMQLKMDISSYSSFPSSVFGWMDRIASSGHMIRRCSFLRIFQNCFYVWDNYSLTESLITSRFTAGGLISFDFFTAKSNILHWEK